MKDLGCATTLLNGHARFRPSGLVFGINPNIETIDIERKRSEHSLMETGIC
jgi:hypothetical protein